MISVKKSFSTSKDFMVSPVGIGLQWKAMHRILRIMRKVGQCLLGRLWSDPVDGRNPAPVDR